MMQPGPWRRAASGAGLLGADGRPGTTVFAEMSALALATGAINLGQGFPDTDGPAEVLDAAREAIARTLNRLSNLHTDSAAIPGRSRRAAPTVRTPPPSTVNAAAVNRENCVSR